MIFYINIFLLYKYIYIYIYMSQNLSGKKNSNLTKKKKKIYNMIMSIRQISENEKQMLPEYRKEISQNEKKIFIMTIKTYFNLEKLTYL